MLTKKTMMGILFGASIFVGTQATYSQQAANAPPVYYETKEWLNAIRSLRPGLKKLIVEKTGTSTCIAVFQSSNDCLAIFLYDFASKDTAPEVSYDIRDNDGNSLLDTERMKSIKSDDLNKHGIVVNSDNSTSEYNFVLGTYYPIKKHYTGTANLVWVAKQPDGKYKTSEILFKIDWSK